VLFAAVYAQASSVSSLSYILFLHEDLGTAGVLLCGTFPETTRGYKHCMVAIGHFSKDVELVPIQDKEAPTTAAAFAAAVLGRYGSPGEVVTNRGGDWEDHFDQQLLDCMIDHRHTSASHQSDNGLAEQAVGTVKGLSASYVLRKEHSRNGTNTCLGCSWITTLHLRKQQ
jgi:hypothetical protein